MQQAAGGRTDLGSRGGRLELPVGLEVDHPALKGSAFRSCPSCIERHPDWEQQLLTSLGVAQNGSRPSLLAEQAIGDDVPRERT